MRLWEEQQEAQEVNADNLQPQEIKDIISLLSLLQKRQVIKRKPIIVNYNGKFKKTIKTKRTKSIRYSVKKILYKNYGLNISGKSKRSLIELTALLKACLKQ
ncbi:MAG: hypothetical protein PHE73_09160 [Sulfurovaceae bacterium]|nr:hypothetical protein [Sulfurovaceae bacterium]